MKIAIAGAGNEESGPAKFEILPYIRHRTCCDQPGS